MSWRRSPARQGVQFVIDERTMERMEEAARVRQVEVELLMVELLAEASRRVDELLGPTTDASAGGAG